MKRNLLNPLLLILLVVGLNGALKAETRDDALSRRHQLRIGYGDALMDGVKWHADRWHQYGPYPAEWTFQEKHHYQYLGHFMVDYQYRLTSWFGLGLQFDYSRVNWDLYTFNGQGTQLSLEDAHYCNTSFLLPLQFTWARTRHTSWYAGLQPALSVNGGTETDEKGRHTVLGYGVGITLLGFSYDWRRYFVAGEVGGLSTMWDTGHITQLFSRAFMVSGGVRFNANDFRNIIKRKKQ